MPRWYLSRLIFTQSICMCVALYEAVSDLRPHYPPATYGPSPNSTHSWHSMDSSVPALDYEHNSSPRPLKRARKSPAQTPSGSGVPDEHALAHNTPLDHIFIADGVTSKKVGKKVSLRLVGGPSTLLSEHCRFPCRVVNVDGEHTGLCKGTEAEPGHFRHCS